MVLSSTPSALRISESSRRTPVKSSGTFTIGYREDAIPYSYRNSLGEPDGYSVELCRAIATIVKDACATADSRLEDVALSYATEVGGIWLAPTFREAVAGLPRVVVT